MPLNTLCKSIVHVPFLLLCLPSTRAQVAATAGSSDSASPSSPARTLDIYYTGKLFGYYRMEAGESSTNPVLSPVANFLGWRSGAQGLLLGMGDNFAPEFGAGIQLEDAGIDGCHSTAPDATKLPESLYKDQTRVAPAAQCDNVLRFMMQAGYRALVPGREDFIYTSYWLHRVAVMTQNMSLANRRDFIANNEEHRTQLLAANLRIPLGGGGKLGVDAGGGKAGDPGCPLLFAVDGSPNTATCTGGSNPLPNTFDWLSRLDKVLTDGTAASMARAVDPTQLIGDVANAANQRTTLQQNRETVAANELKIMTAAWGTRCTIPDPIKRLLQGDKYQPPAADKTQPSAMKIDDACMDSNKVTRETDQHDLQEYWSDLSTRLDKVEVKSVVVDEKIFKGNDQSNNGIWNPVISRTAAIDAEHGLLRTIDREMNGAGYTVAVENGSRVLLIGVVGRETMSAISATNLKMCAGQVDPVSKNPRGGAAQEQKRTEQSANQQSQSVPYFLSCSPGSEKVVGSVTVFDPVAAVADAVRAARYLEGKKFDRVIVMAQMPAPEAQVLAARVRSRLLQATPDQQQMVDLVLSEAQTDYQTPVIDLTLNDLTQATPVMAPDAASVSSNVPTGANGMYGTISLATLTGPVYHNEIAHLAMAPSGMKRNAVDVAHDRFPADLAHSNRFMGVRSYLPCVTHINGTTSQEVLDDPLQCRYETVLAMLEAAQRQAEQPEQRLLGGETEQSDVVLLQRRDVFMGDLWSGYDGSDDVEVYCKGYQAPAGGSPGHCLLRVALDRVLWKGDYLERIAVTGSDLKKVLDTSITEQSNTQTSLIATDLTQQWLVVYGVSQPSLKNLTNVESSDDPLWIAQDAECKASAVDAVGGGTTYCVNGQVIGDDDRYWIVTSDHLAEDDVLYTPLGQGKPQTRAVTTTFLTAQIARGLENMRGAPPKTAPPNANAMIALAVTTFEQQRLFQIDFNKVVLGFNSGAALGPTDVVPTELQGVADSRAAVPHSQDFDAEAALRLASDHPFFGPATAGTQTSFAYERTVKGSLTGSPETVTYQQNTATFGAFAQIDLFPHPWIRSRAEPKNMLVLAPHQYQTQVNNARLFLPFTNGGGQLSIALPLVSSFNDKAGFRREWGVRSDNKLDKWNVDANSYAEGGFEFSVQNNILNSITLANGNTQLPCVAMAGTDIGTCFKKAKATFPISASTTLVGSPSATTLHTPGVYWDTHLERKLDFFKRFKVPPALVSESAGDIFFGRPADKVLPTQTNYAFTWNTSLSIPVYGNLSIAPAYNIFFYRPQLSVVSEQIRTFTFTLRWYFAQHNRVPVPVLLTQSGPTSADQTKNSVKPK